MLLAGVPGSEIARQLDIDQRWVSLIKAGLDEQLGTGPTDAGPSAKKSKGGGAHRALKKYNRLLMKQVPLEKRARILGELVDSEHPVVKQKALERIDDLGGMIPSRQPPPPPQPPPLFCLPADATIDMIPFKRVARGEKR